MITHTAFDWLFRHALLSIKTSTSFLKGSNRGIANHKYAVRRAQLKSMEISVLNHQSHSQSFIKLINVKMPTIVQLLSKIKEDKH